MFASTFPALSCNGEEVCETAPDNLSCNGPPPASPPEGAECLMPLLGHHASTDGSVVGGDNWQHMNLKHWHQKLECLGRRQRAKCPVQ